MMAIVEMLQANTVIQEIETGFYWIGEEELRIHDEMIVPLLEANATRARVRALADAWHEACWQGHGGIQSQSESACGHQHL